MLDQYRREVLENGLRVVGVERPELHSFVCSVYIHAGPRFESPTEVGLTHFLEHMLVQGSENYPTSNDIMRGVEDLGGVINGQTHPEFLGFNFSVHRKHWRKLMDIASDVLLRPLFDPEEIEQEKSIIAQEISQHRDSRGRNISTSELAYSLLFKEKIAEVGTRGGPEIARHFDRETVMDHYRRFFVPENMVICLAGGFDFEELLPGLRDHFGRMEPGPVPSLPSPEVDRGGARAVYRSTEALPVVEVLLGHRAYALGDERFDATRAVARLLGGGLSSRLFSHVREELGLVYDIESHVQAYSDSGSLAVFFSVGVENLLDALRAAMQVQQEARRGNFAERELERYKESARCGVEILCDRPTQLANWFGKQELFLGLEALRTPRQYVEKQESLTLEELDHTMHEVFVREGANLVVVGPYGEQERQQMQKAFPAEEPEIEPVGAAE